MEWLLRSSLGVFLWSVVAVAAAAQETDESANPNQCFACHGNHDVWEQDTLHLYVTADHIQADIHWQKGILCHDCHGGNPNTVNLREAARCRGWFSRRQVSGGCRSLLRLLPLKSGLHAAFSAIRPARSGGRFLDQRPRTGPPGRHRICPGRRDNGRGRRWSGGRRDNGRGVAGPEAAELDTPAPPPMTCLACHPVHNMRLAADPLSSLHPLNLEETCGNCHREQRTAMRQGVHHAAGGRNALGAGTPLDCRRCHGENAHQIIPVKDSRSPVYLNHQVELCGSCHLQHLASYNASIHGHGLRESGLLVTAACADCHGAHGIFYAADRRSTLHRTNVAQTCGECHRYIEERLNQSVHAQSNETPAPPQSPADGQARQRQPGCVDCHQGHDESQHLAAGYRLTLLDRCGNCHADLLLGYHVSMHGQLTRLGFEAAATCSDCHGAHTTLAISDPRGPLSPENRLQTCRKCHHNAVANFADFNPHANHKDKQRFPHLYHLYSRAETLIYLLFGFFLLHAILWYGRSLLSTLRYGRDRTLVTDQTAVVRFSPQVRAGYLFLLGSLMGLIFTGLPIKYSGQASARRWVRAMGGFESTSVCHHFFAAVLLTVAGLHLISVVRRILRLRAEQVGWKTLLFGPDSLVPNGRDIRDFGRMTSWFFGAGSKPQFERWTYWEKFDYWAIYLVAAGIVVPGLMLWLPNVFCRFLPGWSLNVAAVLHSETSVLGSGLLLLIHLFNTHLRPEKFPMDLSLVTGLVSEQHLRRARPEYLDRLRREGRLKLVTAPQPRQLRLIIVAVYLLLLLGLSLLAWSLLASLGK